MHDIAMDKMSVKEYANPFSEAEQQAYKQEKAKRKKYNSIMYKRFIGITQKNLNNFYKE